MIRRWSAPLCLWAAAMLHAGAASAGVWGMDPVIGVTADYATNPGLLEIAHTAQTDAALLIDSPTTYNGNDFKLTLLPSFRIGDTQSFASVNSDYEHLNLKGEFDSERSTWTAMAGVSRDSTLYQEFVTNGEAGARRDGAVLDLTWDRFMTEELEVNTDVNSTRIRYSAPVGEASLVDYKYTSVTPTMTLNATERGKFTLSATAGQYDSLDGSTRSRNANLQLGFLRQISQIWSVTASGGYSRSTNRIDLDEYLCLTANGLGIATVCQGTVIEVTPLRVKSSRNGSVYSVDLTRRGERLTLDFTASRQELPTGFAFLSRQSSFEFKANYYLSTRWSLGADARYVSAQDPESDGASANRTVSYAALNSSWQWTEHWTLTAGVTRVTEHYQSTSFNLSSNQIALTLSRQFNHITFQ
jgi:hypothetical protein